MLEHCKCSYNNLAMKLILALTLVCVCQLLDASPVIEERNQDQDALYEAHKTTHNLTYTGEEDDARKAEFKKTDDIINAHNADPTKTSTLGHNEFSTKYQHEAEAMNKYVPSNNKAPTETTTRMIADRSPPTNLDWRDNNGNYLSDIQHQGLCGSCWTFSASASLESRYAIKNKLTYPNIPKLSEQCLVDCAHSGDTDVNTCATGGNYGTAWSWVASVKGEAVGEITGTNPAALPKPTTGQNLASEYPYVDKNYCEETNGNACGQPAHTCSFSAAKGNDVSTSTYESSFCLMTSTSWEYDYTTYEYVKHEKCVKYEKRASYSITPNSPSAMITALQAGPVSVSIYGSGTKFQNYETGILQEVDCPMIKIDHAVNLIGYGEDSNGNLFWLGRNSYGTGWGLKGYFMFERKTTNGVGTCGVLTGGEYPKL